MAETTVPSSNRNLAIDMLRALTMATMIFVNDFWKVHDIPQWMLHARGGVDFMGLSDFVLPMFLFVVGMSIPYAIENRYRKGLSAESTVGHIFSRTLSLLIMGAFLANSESRGMEYLPEYKTGIYWFLTVAGFLCIWNAYPKDASSTKKKIFTLLKILGGCILLYLAWTFRNPRGGVFQARWGILGGIGWTYIVVAFVYLLARSDLKKLAWVWLAMLFVVVVDSPLRNELGGEPIFNFPRPNFWEGFIRVTHVGNSSLMALGGAILSVATEKIAGMPEKKRVLIGLSAAAVSFILCAVTRRFWIMAKIGLTIPCIFMIYGTAALLYTLFRVLCNHGITGWYKAIKPAGTATLTTYMIPYLMYGLDDLFGRRDVIPSGIIAPDWFTHGVFSYINCICFVFLCIGVVAVLNKLHIKLKV